VEDSLQIYSLIAHAVQKLRSPVLTSAIAKAIKPYIRPTKNIPGLGSLGSTKEVERLLENTFPLNPITLYVLPRLSARVAQNERTLFHFLLGQESDCLFPIIEHSANAQHLVSVAHLFDYFSDVMQRDTGVGGVYRRYGEIVTALGHRSGGQIFTFTFDISNLPGVRRTAYDARVEDLVCQCLLSRHLPGQRAKGNLSR
jgi:hypothetical protein